MLQEKMSIFQIVTGKYIFFYTLDYEDKEFIPKHKSTMFNFSACTGFIFGHGGKKCIIYKQYQPDFQVFYRNLSHNFMQTIHDTERENVCIARVPKLNCFLVSVDD